MSNDQHRVSTPTENSPIDCEYTCTHCGCGFDASMVHLITIVDDTEAELLCPWCKRTDTYARPDAEKIQRPPATVDHAIVINDHGLTTARLFFEGGAWIQFREASDGWVYEEMFNADGERIESFTLDVDREDVTPATASLQRLTL